MKKSIILMALMFIISCGEPSWQKKKLLDGYEIFRVYGNVHALSKPNREILVHGNVIKVADNSSYIVGIRVVSVPSVKRSSEFKDQPYGYFIFDKKSGELSIGLSEEEFNKIATAKSIGLNL